MGARIGRRRGTGLILPTRGRPCFREKGGSSIALLSKPTRRLREEFLRRTLDRRTTCSVSEGDKELSTNPSARPDQTCTVILGRRVPEAQWYGMRRCSWLLLGVSENCRGSTMRPCWCRCYGRRKKVGETEGDKQLLYQESDVEEKVANAACCCGRGPSLNLENKTARGQEGGIAAQEEIQKNNVLVVGGFCATSRRSDGDGAQNEDKGRPRVEPRVKLVWRGEWVLGSTPGAVLDVWLLIPRVDPTPAVPYCTVVACLQ